MYKLCLFYKHSLKIIKHFAISDKLENLVISSIKHKQNKL